MEDFSLIDCAEQTRLRGETDSRTTHNYYINDYMIDYRYYTVGRVL